MGLHFRKRLSYVMLCWRLAMPFMIMSGVCTISSAQTITRAEYFFDIDPGVGNGIPLPIPAPATDVTFTSTISTAGLDPGYHILFVRTKSSDDLWSLYDYREFVIEVPIQQAEYFFDTDPGIGNGHPITVAPGQFSFSPTISTTGLGDGEHLLFVRTKQADRWSLAEPLQFYIETRIAEVEYFIDTDPGLGNATPIPIASPAINLTINTTVNVGTLGDGVHYLFVRTKDILGNWSFYEGQQFVVAAPLPVELVDFNATVTEDSKVRLSWTTLSEKHSSFFSVTHSMSGFGFSEISRVPAGGESNIPRKYSDLDPHPVLGNNYYQLKAVDLDGTIAFSDIVVARIDNIIGPQIYPNPVVSEWTIDFYKNESRETFVIDLFDINGKKQLSIKTDDKVLQMNRQGLASGIYLLKISSEKGVKQFKICLQ